MKIDLIIPVYKPEKSFLDMVDEMAAQSLPLNRIIIINTEQKYFDRLIYTSRFLDKHKNLDIHHISKREFDYGKTRNNAVKLSDADYFIMMTQDAMPVGKEIISKLLKPFENDPLMAVTYARQVSVESAHEFEKFIRKTYFPENSEIHSDKDSAISKKQLYMNSNVCAMYRRDLFVQLGGFLNHVIMGEDVLFASKVINEGYKVGYVADAVIVHTREADEKLYLHKAFDFGVSVAKHPEVYDAFEEKEEMKQLEKRIMAHLRRNGTSSETLLFSRLSRAKRKGFAKGLKYKRLSRNDIMKYSANSEYWRMDEILRDRKSVDVHSGYGRSAAEVEMVSTPPVTVTKKNVEE